MALPKPVAIQCYRLIPILSLDKGLTLHVSTQCPWDLQKVSHYGSSDEDLDCGGRRPDKFNWLSPATTRSRQSKFCGTTALAIKFLT